MGYLLFFVAMVLLWLLAPLFLLYALIKGQKKSKYFGDVAFAIDQLGNVMGAPIMNDVLLKKSSTYLYGDPDMTISHVTGVNYLSNNLTYFGLLIAKILNFVDPNHVENAAINEQ